MDELQTWLATTQYKDHALEVASEDASFRKYYRLKKGEQTFIVMDASLEKDSLKPFLQITEKLHDVCVKAPIIYLQNLELGYLIIEDFGIDNYLDLLCYDNHEEMYKKAIDVILQMQTADITNLPMYDRDFLIFEMSLMKEWYIEKFLPAPVSQDQFEIIDSVIGTIADVVLTQPQNVFVHRDFHSRNIMLTPSNEVGVIDYQDAMNGSITYDIASLLEDSYIEFDRQDMQKLVLYFKEKKQLDVDDATFIKWFDFTSMQRHIKVLGIFARLFKRDGKKNYIKDIPLTFKYLFDTSKLYEETKPLYNLLKEL